MKELSHTNDKGQARMVDVSIKPEQMRIARASGFIHLQDSTLNLIKENRIKKGDVLSIAEIAGVQGAKRTFELIPLCHTLLLTNVLIEANVADNGVRVVSEVRCVGKTGVEMEALTGVSVALLTIYDMCKAVDKLMEISDVKLDYKEKL